MRCVWTGLTALAFVGAAPAAWAWAQPQPQEPGFSQTSYATGLGQVTDLAWAADGSNVLFVAQRNGVIRVVRNNTLQGANFATVSVYTAPSECGLIGICVDAQYPSQPYLWAFATVNSSTQRIYRCTISTAANGDIVISGSPQAVGPVLPCNNANHDGGAIIFGPDGNLYFGVGNLGNGSGAYGNGTGTAGNPDEFNTLGSKIGRMDRNGNALSANPWNDNDGNVEPRDYIWSRGWRNPFGLLVQPSTNTVWCLEVGDGYEHVFHVTQGSNRGWPTENNTTNTSILIPRFAYDRDTGGWTNGTGCITRGTFYNGSSFPLSYQGNLFFAEYRGNKIIRANVSGTNTFSMSSTSAFVNSASSVVDVVTGPDGALYYNSGGTIYRLQYNSTTSQAILVSPTSLTVDEGGAQGTFTVRLAADPGGSGRTVTVSRTGDTDIVIDSATTTLSFTSANWSSGLPVRVRALEDTDTTNGSATLTFSSTGLTSVTATVTERDNDTANTAPTATIAAPLNGQVVSGSAAEFYGDGADNVAPVRAEFYVDGILEYTDTSAPTGNQGHYHYGGGHNRWDTTAYSDGVHTLRLVVYDAAGLSGSAQITVVINNSGTANVYQQDPGSDGLVSLEAEDFDVKTDRGDSWTPVTSPAGFSGTGALQALANDGTIYADSAANYLANSPRLDYRVNFLRAGTYVVWILGNGPTGSDDSVHVGLDGAAVTSAERIDVAEGAGYVWSNQTMAPAVATITVSTAGVHVLNVLMREDGFILDKILLTLSSGYAPTGAGPAASARALDTDFDGIPDAAEATYGLNASVADQDGDGVTDGQNDWNGNGISNALEVAQGGSPGTPGSGGGGGGGSGGGGGGCGATGAEVLGLLALLAARRRSGR
jgi:glucose/arabinose dehydrogenase